MSTIRFKARLLQPAANARRVSWSFVVLPRAASAKLGTRGMTSVRGRINGHPFRTTLEPDGKHSHWLKVSEALCKAANLDSRELLTLEIEPLGRALESRVPPDLRKALAAMPKALATWSGITPVARRDWIQWINSARKAETRARRIGNASRMLASGKRRVCCFDRSGVYSKGLAAPEAAR